MTGNLTVGKLTYDHRAKNDMTDINAQNYIDATSESDGPAIQEIALSMVKTNKQQDKQDIKRNAAIDQVKNSFKNKFLNMGPESPLVRGAQVSKDSPSRETWTYRSFNDPPKQPVKKKASQNNIKKLLQTKIINSSNNITKMSTRQKKK